MPLTTAEKIEGIEESGFRLAFDGCHKIYFVKIEAERLDAEMSGYDTYPANLIRECIDKSCGLVFVHPWSLAQHEWNIDQCTEDIFEAASAR